MTLFGSEMYWKTLENKHAIKKVNNNTKIITSANVTI